MRRTCGCAARWWWRDGKSSPKTQPGSAAAALPGPACTRRLISALCKRARASEIALHARFVDSADSRRIQTCRHPAMPSPMNCVNRLGSRRSAQAAPARWAWSNCSASVRAGTSRWTARGWSSSARIAAAPAGDASRCTRHREELPPPELRIRFPARCPERPLPWLAGYGRPGGSRPRPHARAGHPAVRSPRKFAGGYLTHGSRCATVTSWVTW